MDGVISVLRYSEWMVSLLCHVILNGWLDDNDFTVSIFVLNWWLAC